MCGVGASTVSDDVAQCDESASAKLGESPNVMRNVRDHRCGWGLLTLNQPGTSKVGMGESAYRVDFGVLGTITISFLVQDWG